MLINILQAGHKDEPRVFIQIETSLQKGESIQIPQGHIYLEIPLSQPIPIPFYKNAQGTLPSQVTWKPTSGKEPAVPYKPFFFPRNLRARQQEHYAGKTCLFLRLPGIIHLGYINRLHVSQLEAWFKIIEPKLPALLLAGGNHAGQTQNPQNNKPIGHIQIALTDTSMEAGIEARGIQF
jgi:hypothetical protein